MLSVNVFDVTVDIMFCEVIKLRLNCLGSQRDVASYQLHNTGSS